jgi:hypothetical protein
MSIFNGDKSEKMSQLIDNGWIDNRTRLVTVDFGLYCAAERMFSTVQVRKVLVIIQLSFRCTNNNV